MFTILVPSHDIYYKIAIPKYLYTVSITQFLLFWFHPKVFNIQVASHIFIKQVPSHSVQYTGAVTLCLL